MEVYRQSYQHQHRPSAELKEDYSTSEVVVNSGSQSHPHQYHHQPLTPNSTEMSRLNSSTSEVTDIPILLGNTTGGIIHHENGTDSSSTIDEISLDELFCHNYGISLDSLDNLHDTNNPSSIDGGFGGGSNFNSTLTSSPYGNSSDSFPIGMSSGDINLDAFGNAFHENMFEIVMAEIEPFTDTLPTEYFVQGWEIVEGKLFVIIGDDDTGLEVARVELVCG